MFRMYEWKPNDLAFGQQPQMGFVQPSEPKVVFKDENDVAVLTLSSSKLEYNRDVFSSDSYQQAAKRLFDALDRPIFSKNLKTIKRFDFKLVAYKEFPERMFEILSDGTINHNYDLDHWHWWLFECFSELVRKKYNI